MGIAIELTSYLFNNLVPATMLPAMDFSDKVPSEHKTIVVIPVILSGKDQIEKYAQKLEKYYLANPQPNIYFSLLADFKDAKGRELEEDRKILDEAIQSFDKLNDKYSSNEKKFGFFIRYRQWNEKENCWMGWERKRGKLEEFNALLLGDNDTSFMNIYDNDFLKINLKYIITIDSDTDLIRGSAAKLIGIIAHPLNRPVINPQTRKVERGYVIVQSQIRNHVEFSNRSIFSKVFSGQQGIDAYSNVVSDIYQDTFQSGTFLGKGIYDIKTMHQLLNKTLPENSVLSHDLLESCYTKCAFAGNVELMDTYPSSVISFSKREHRWIRGDWQLLPWLFGKDSLGGLSRWKIFDNMRRSVTPLFRLMLIILNAFLLPESFYIWIPIVFFGEFLRLLHLAATTISARIAQPMSKVAFRNLFNAVYIIMEQAAFRFILLPYRAWVSIDAIARTLYRLYVSKKQLLQWETAEAAEKSTVNSIGTYFKMWKSALPASIILIVAAFLSNPVILEKIEFVLIALIWTLSPLFSYVISIANKKIRQSLPLDEKYPIIRTSARMTWQYFEDFCTESNNYLCPDNYQIFPNKKVSLKTSPTNIGLQLMSFLSAKDMGYIGLISFVEYVEKTISTIEKLDKWNGHLYNWYSIDSLEKLYPEYVSTVDSGNFVSYLIVISNGLKELKKNAVFDCSVLKGIADLIEIAEIDIDAPKEFGTISDFENHIKNMITQIERRDLKPWEKQSWVSELLSQCNDTMRDFELICDKSVLYSNQNNLEEAAAAGIDKAIEMIARINSLIKSIENMIEECSFKYLYDTDKELFYIGFNSSSQNYDSGHYDLIASEAMLTSYLAIAKNEVPRKHWTKMGRPLTMCSGFPTFVSWSGTMFEYLLPYLTLNEFPGSVYSITARAAVKEQIAYGKKQNIPWGISESQYYRFDVESNYQYKAFGVPKLSQQPYLSQSLVVAPYASFLAMHFNIKKSIKNILKLKEIGAYGEYGFYEAIDYNSPDAENMKSFSIVKCYMTHHQGMSLVSVNNLLNRNIMRRRFHSEPMIKSAQVMLEEVRTAYVVPIAPKGYSLAIKQSEQQVSLAEYRHVLKTVPDIPRVLWLSNNRYSLMITSDGDGFSKVKGTMVNRWTSDTDEFSGQYIFIKETESGKYWSATYRPTMVDSDNYKAQFTISKAEFSRRDGDISTVMEVTLSPDKDIEIRKLTITNHSLRPYKIETTSYLEVVMDEFYAGLYHPAFNKLFIETDIIDEGNVLICERRKGSDEKNQFLFHMVKTNAKRFNVDEYETDRYRFIGRNNTLKNPDAIVKSIPLSNSAEFSIDPILSIRTKIIVPAARSVTITYITGVCDTKQQAADMATDYESSYNINDTFNQFQLNSELEIKYLGLTAKQVNVIQDLIGPVFYSNRLFRADEHCLINNNKGQSALWRFGISGDNPILVYKIKSLSEINVANDVLKAYEYMRINGINVDLVILDEEEGGYFRDVRSMLTSILASLRVYAENLKKLSLFVISSSQINNEEYNVIMSTAKILFTEDTGIYFRNIQKETVWRGHVQKKPIDLIDTISPNQTEHITQKSNLEYFNGYGGFINSGREYEILLDKKLKTPMPWINVVSNDEFGFIISESGGGHTWAVNSSENKLTSWSNDPVVDPKSEMIIIQDKKSKRCIYPICYDNDALGAYSVKHGFGYSVFSHKEMDINQTLMVFVPEKDSVKLWQLEIENESGEERELYVILHLKWELGRNIELTTAYINTSFSIMPEYLAACNTYSETYRAYKAFVFSSEKISSYTGDRNEVLYKKDRLSKSEAQDLVFSKTVGAGYDPSGTIQIEIKLAAKEKKKIIFGLGYSKDEEEIERICHKYKQAVEVEEELKNIKEYWEKLTNKIVVTSNNRAMDFLVNGWLIYQTYACRIKARAAFYQAGGAYGFRDQLQDVLALLHAEPEAVKKHILLACSKQFEEGDVLHWWHPPTGEGVRTRISDDYLWLPYVTAEYIKHTGDYSILDNKVPYISAPKLANDEREKMVIPQISEKAESVYDHCIAAINRVELGSEGIPLIGGGDWNDGMNNVGIYGKGQSVWLGWFVYKTYSEYLEIAEYKKDENCIKKLCGGMQNIAKNIEENAWDGRWYVRAFYDDGTKLGSQESMECMIDSISQSWAVISKAAEKNRAKTSMDSAMQMLVKQKENLILLLTPPFDKTAKYPGYIKDYYPGIRENGGQYTHASVWMAIAEMIIGNKQTAMDLLSMLNPIYSTLTQKDAMKYAKEPYVMSGDVYYTENYKGCAGWSWYTGSSGWMYQALVTWLLGIKKKNNMLVIEPSVPAYFGEYIVKYRFGSSIYIIDIPNIENNEYEVKSIIVDGVEIFSNTFELVDDKNRHYIHININ